MKDQEFVQATRKALREAVSFFSNERKRERELWVVNEFLGNLGILAGNDIFSSDNEPPDVQYMGANFEVKEILDPGKQRHAEYKESLRRAEQAESAADLFEEYQPRDILYSEICGLVVERLDNERKYAPAVKRKLDVLFYVNLEDVHGYVSDTLPSSIQIARFGWRSVSFLAGPMSSVLHACADSPRFLQSIEGKVIRKGSAVTEQSGK